MEELIIPKAHIRIIGTSHIATSSARTITSVFNQLNPDIVCVELDKRRLQSLLEKSPDQRLPLSLIKQVGVTGYLFLAIGKMVQKRMGSIVKVDPGVDMLAAINLAKEHGKQLHLIDQDIIITMRHLSEKFTFREKMRVLWDIISVPFSKKKRLQFNLEHVPDSKVLETLMGFMEKRYPSLHHVLIIERNIVMARNIDAIVRKNPGKTIIVTIGAGHEKDLRERLKNLERLADVSSN